MKKHKLVPLTLAGVLSMSITSCEKDRTCECTITSGSTSVTLSATLIKVTERQAKDICVSTIQYDSNGQIDYTADCKLK